MISLASIENFGSMNVLCSDKTGTLTEGSYSLNEVVTEFGLGEDHVFPLIASVEIHSDHFLAKEILRKAREKGLETSKGDSFVCMFNHFQIDRFGNSNHLFF
jgi:cation transport ATPase